LKFAGIPADLLDSFPSLKAFRNSIATIPEIKEYYAAATDDVRKNGYTPDLS
jgi:glutathione S-transferase